MADDTDMDIDKMMRQSARDLAKAKEDEELGGVPPDAEAEPDIVIGDITVSSPSQDADDKASPDADTEGGVQAPTPTPQDDVPPAQDLAARGPIRRRSTAGDEDEDEDDVPTALAPASGGLPRRRSTLEDPTPASGFRSSLCITKMQDRVPLMLADKNPELTEYLLEYFQDMDEDGDGRVDGQELVTKTYELLEKFDGARNAALVAEKKAHVSDNKAREEEKKALEARLEVVSAEKKAVLWQRIAMGSVFGFLVLFAIMIGSSVVANNVTKDTVVSEDHVITEKGTNQPVKTGVAGASLDLAAPADAVGAGVIGCMDSDQFNVLKTESSMVPISLHTDKEDFVNIQTHDWKKVGEDRFMITDMSGQKFLVRKNPACGTVVKNGRRLGRPTADPDYSIEDGTSTTTSGSGITLNGKYAFLARGKVAGILGAIVPELAGLVGEPLAAAGYFTFTTDGGCSVFGRRNLGGGGDASQIKLAELMSGVVRERTTGTEELWSPQQFPVSDLSIYETCECTYSFDARDIGTMVGRFCDAPEPYPLVYWTLAVAHSGKKVNFVRNDWTMLIGSADSVEEWSEW